MSQLDVHGSLQPAAVTQATIGFSVIQPVKPYANDAHCREDGRICICSTGLEVLDTDKNGFNKFKRKHGNGSSSTGCQQWHFQVGDVILMERPNAIKPEYIPAVIVSGITNSPVVHAAIVTWVPPSDINQTADNIIITEALKGGWKRVVQNTFRSLVERYPFGGVSIRRVDAKKYPKFFTPEKLSSITRWSKARVGDGFDEKMLIPLKRRFSASDRYVPINPSCRDRKVAIAKYKKGGPGKWICSEFVAWTLAFPGGLNLDYGSDDDCDNPPWQIKNIQPFPGQLTHTAYFDPDLDWHMPCNHAGCFLAVPDTAAWAGGTTTTRIMSKLDRTSREKKAEVKHNSPERKKETEGKHNSSESTHDSHNDISAT